jgi:hypothetical protein
METKTMRSKIGEALWVITAIIVMLTAFGQSASAQFQETPLIGTWQVKVTLLDCQSGNPLGPPPFSSLLTFARGGTLAEDTTNPSFAPGQRGPGQGVWQESSHEVYQVRSVAFINFTTPPNPATHNPGFNAGQQIITQTVTYNDQSDQWSAVGAITFTDSTGAVYRQGCAAATATRF